MTTMLERLGDRIQRAHDALGHTLGWRLLASPARTVSPETMLAFVGLNPGGCIYEPPQLSTERGNAYRVERWGPNGRASALQVQVRRMYEEIAPAEAGPAEVDNLMDTTLAAHLCPFRSPDWAGLPNHQQSIAFSLGVWGEILDVAQPRVFICMSDAATCIGRVLERKGARPVAGREVHATGWGQTTYSLSRYEWRHGSTLLVRLPHLSRYRIFGRPKSKDATQHLVTAIRAALWPANVA